MQSSGDDDEGDDDDGVISKQEYTRNKVEKRHSIKKVKHGRSAGHVIRQKITLQRASASFYRTSVSPQRRL